MRGIVTFAKDPIRAIGWAQGPPQGHALENLPGTVPAKVIKAWYQMVCLALSASSRRCAIASKRAAISADATFETSAVSAL